MSLRDTLLALQPQQPNGTTYSALGTTAQPLPDPLQDERDFGNPLTRGLGQAVRGVKGSTKAYVASALDATGHSDAAKGWWDSAAQDAQRAAYVGPDVQNLGQVHDADTALQYALGAVGKGAAYIPPAMAGAVAGRMGLGRFMNPNLAATLGGAAVMHPTMAGGVAQELHEDSAAAGMSPQEKFARANLVGGAQGAVMAAVPAAMTGRMLTPVPVNSLRQALLGAGVQTAKSAAEAGAAVGASDVIGQAHKMQYDPNAKFDPMRVADAAAQGSLGMAPVGAVHGAVAHGVDLVASGGRLAAKGGVALSDTALKAANGAADPLRTVGDAFNAYRTHPELATLMADQRLPAELVNAPDEQVNAWAASNENMQREAALAIARRTVDDPNAPAQSVAVAQHLLDNANDPEAWKPFVGGLVAQERSRRVGENIREAAGELVNRLGGAKQNLEPTRDDEVFLSRLAPDLDSTFGSPLTEHVRNTAAGVLKDYVLGDFGRDDNGNVTVPHGLTAAFGAGTPEIIGKAYDLLRRQGRTQEIDAGAQAALADIQSLVDSRVPQYKRASQAVWDNLTPEAMDALPAEDYPHIADSIRRYIDGGKKIPDVEAQLDQWFGANKDKVLAQIDLLHERNRLQGKSYGDESATTPNRGESDAAAKDYEPPLQERESSYAYHFGDKEGRPFDLANDYVGDHIQRVERNLDTERYNARYDKTTGREVVRTEPVGIVDYAKATGDNRQLDALRQQHATEYETRGSRGLDQMLNDRYKVLRSQERTNDQPEAVEIRPGELNAPATVGGRANKRAWSDVTKLGQRDVSTIADGRIFLPEGEPGGRKYGKDFVTSAQKLISKMWERKGQGAFDERTAEQTGPKDMLNMFSAGLSSLLNSGKFQGEMRVRMADGAEHVVNGMRSLPDDFALFRRADGSVLTLGEARRSISEEVGRAVVDEGRIARDPQTKQPHIYDSEKEALGHVDKEAGQFVGKYGDNFAVFEKKGAELPQDKVRETAGPKGHAITETDEMSMQANKKLDATERNFDELTGAELHPKEGKLDQRARRLDGLRREYAEKVTKIKELEAAPANAVRDGKLRLLKSQTAELVKQGKELAAEYRAAAAKADGKKFNAEPVRKLLDNPRFNAWFGDSKMRTKDGAPFVFYHSSDAAFDTFDPARAGANTNHASAGLGIFVSPSAERSAVYGQHTMPLYVRMERPYRMSLEEFSSFADLAQSKARARALQAQGYDGVFVPTDGTTIVFDPTQLKATDNNGNFSAFDANTKRSDEPLGAKASAEELKAANDYITKTLGPAMHREFVDAFGHGGSGEWEQGVVRVATSALNPLSVAYHESMHELFSRLTEAGRGKDAETLLKAASSPLTLRRLERFFADDKFEAVREAIRNDPQERLAYMYQLWASGKMKFGPETQTIFQRVANLIRRITGMLTNDQRAELILKAFHDGKLAEPNEMAKALDGIAARGDTLRAVAKKIDPVLKRGQELVGTAEAQLTGSANPYLNQIGRLFNNKVGATDKDQGFLQAHVQANNQWLNRFGAVVRDAGEHVEKADLDMALEALQTGMKAKDPVARKIQDGVQQVFDEMHEYLRGADVRRYDAEKQQWEPLGKIVNYFPRAWDSASLVRDGAAFKDRLLKFHADELEAIAAQANKEVAAKQDAGELTASWRALQDEKTTPVTAEDVAAAILDRLIGSDGQAALDEMPNALGYSPFMKAVNERTLDWIDMRQFHDFQQKDLMQVLSSYVGQATKRAEYTRTFGYDGGKLQAAMEGAWAHEINQIAEREYGVKDAVGQAKALDPEAWQKQLYSVLVSGTKTELTPQDAEALPIRAAKSLEPARRAVMAMEGTLGHDISPLLRKASAYSIVYQNTRLLAYAMFSNLIDPLGIVVRGGEMKDAFVAFRRGMSAIVKEWGDLTGLRERKPEDYDEATRVAEMVGTVDCAGFMSTMGNLYGSQYLPAWAKRWNDNFFRWNGMEAYNKAMRVQATQAAIGFIKRHAENPGEHSERYLKELGITKADVRVQDGRLNTDSPAIQKAIMRWVDGAILRPNAAIRPSWSSDPHFAVFFHLKQFMYATHEVLLKRVVHEVKNGNTNPLLLLAAGYVPVMLAADAAKGILQEAMGAGAPVWEHEGVAGIVAHGVQRAGLLGTGQMALDAKEFGVPGLLGPTAEQIASAFTQPAADSLKEAVGVGPLNFVVKGMAWND